MDSLHQALMEVINHLHDAMREGKGSAELGKIITEMVNYAQYHFTTEDKHLSRNGYPNLRSQKAGHDGYPKKVKEFQRQLQQGKMALSLEGLNFQKEWWLKHFQGEDKMYVPFLNGKGVL
jgi:hemerythrin-like metal-binding protein